VYRAPNCHLWYCPMRPPANWALARQCRVLTTLVLWHGYNRVGGELGFAWKTTTKLGPDNNHIMWRKKIWSRHMKTIGSRTLYQWKGKGLWMVKGGTVLKKLLTKYLHILISNNSPMLWELCTTMTEKKEVKKACIRCAIIM
jgi:hypothetical protein